MFPRFSHFSLKVTIGLLLFFYIKILQTTKKQEKEKKRYRLTRKEKESMNISYTLSAFTLQMKKNSLVAWLHYAVCAEHQISQFFVVFFILAETFKRLIYLVVIISCLKIGSYSKTLVVLSLFFVNNSAKFNHKDYQRFLQGF